MIDRGGSLRSDACRLATDHPGGPTLTDLRFTEQFYVLPEAARIVGVPVGTLRNWVRGYRYRSGRGRAEAAAVIEPPAPDGALSFVNLVEAHTLAAFRECGVSMQKIRPAIAYLARHLDVRHPLANQDFMTDGAELFFRYMKEEREDELVALLNLSRGGQIVFDEVVDRYLIRIDWAKDHYAERLWPAGRDEGIAVDPRRGFGQPIVARRGVRVEDVADRLRAGDLPRAVAEDFGLTPDELNAVRRYGSQLGRLAA